MATRKPLIVNPAASQIQELQTGDSLDGISNLTATGTIAATSYTGSGAQLTGIITVPVGGVIMWGGSVAGVPSGFRLCNGDSLSKSANNNEFLALFNALGYIHGGSGDNFNIPNLRDKFVVGAHADNSDTTYPQIKPGATGGSANAVLVAHNHEITTNDGDNNGSEGEFTPSQGDSTTNKTVSTTGKDAAGSNNNSQTGTNANLPPYYALSFIIKVS